MVQSSWSVMSRRLPNSSVSNSARALVSMVQLNRMSAGVVPVRVVLSTRLTQRGRVILSVAVCTPARSRRALPRARVAPNSLSARVALARVWSNPADCLAANVGEWVRITRRSAPSAVARVS
jgi:hypothetical protein